MHKIIATALLLGGGAVSCGSERAASTDLLATPTTTSALAAATAPRGYRHGAAAVPVTGVATVWASTYGVVANDGLDDTQALQNAIDDIRVRRLSSFDAPVNLQLPAGRIILSDEIHVDHDGIIIRGAGKDPARGGTLIWFRLPRLYQNVNGIPEFNRKFWPGFAAFRVESRQIHPRDTLEGSVNFHWRSGVKVHPLGGGKVGEPRVRLTPGGAARFQAGQTVYVGAANTVAFYQRMDVKASDWINQHMRTQFFTVTAVNPWTDEITLDRPLEFDIPYSNDGLIDGKRYYSKVMPVASIKGVGFSNFAFEATLELTPYADGVNRRPHAPSNPGGVGMRFQNAAPEYAVHGILFKFAEHGWVSDVRIDMAGSHPIVTEFASYMTIQNTTLDGSWNKGKGGHGYLRGSKLYYSLIQNNVVKNLRHLTLQWSATGNLIRGNALEVDLNLHGGWERYNRFENNTVTLPYKYRSWNDFGPENEKWYPIWVGTGQKAGGWSGATGPHNAFVNNRFFKQKTPYESLYTPWKLYSDPGVEYIFNWNGQGWTPLMKPAFGLLKPLVEWAGNENIDFSLAPNHGVFLAGDDPASYAGGRCAKEPGFSNVKLSPLPDRDIVIYGNETVFVSLDATRGQAANYQYSCWQTGGTRTEDIVPYGPQLPNAFMIRLRDTVSDGRYQYRCQVNDGVSTSTCDFNLVAETE